MPGKRPIEHEEVSAKEAAHRLGMTDVSVGEWGAKPGSPTTLKAGKRLYQWPAFPVWYRQQLQRSRDKGGNFEEARTRKMAAEAEIAEYELDRLKGSRHEDGECVAAFGKVLDTLRGTMLAAPGKWSHKFVGLKTMVQSQRILDEMIRDLMTHLSANGDSGSA